MDNFKTGASWKVKGYKDCRMMRACTIYMLHHVDCINVDSLLEKYDLSGSPLTDWGIEQARKDEEYRRELYQDIAIMGAITHAKYINNMLHSLLLADVTYKNEELNSTILYGLRKYIRTINGTINRGKLHQSMSVDYFNDTPYAVQFVHQMFCENALLGNSLVVARTPYLSKHNKRVEEKNELIKKTTPLEYLQAYRDTEENDGNSYKPIKIAKGRANIDALIPMAIGADRSDLLQDVSDLEGYWESVFQFTENGLKQLEEWQGQEIRLIINNLNRAVERYRHKFKEADDETKERLGRLGISKATDEDIRIAMLLGLHYNTLETLIDQMKRIADGMKAKGQAKKDEAALSTAEERVKRAEKSITRKDKKIAELTEENKKLSEKNSKAYKDIEVLKGKSAERCQEEIDGYKKEIARLQGLLNQATGAKDSAERKLKEQGEKKAELEAKVRKLSSINEDIMERLNCWEKDEDSKENSTYDIDNAVIEVKRRLNGRRLIIFGGHHQWREKMDNLLSGCNVHIDAAQTGSSDIISRNDVVILSIRNVAHCMSEPITAKCRLLKIPHEFVNKTNLESVMQTIIATLGGEGTYYR